MHFTTIAVIENIDKVETLTTSNLNTKVEAAVAVSMYPYSSANGNSVFFESYCIGDSWPGLLLLKDTCNNVVLGKESAIALLNGSPKGYRWVAGARKCDIAWGQMKQAALDRANRQFNECCLAIEGEQSNAPYSLSYHIRGNFLEQYGMTVYRHGETFDDHIWRYDLSLDEQYSVRCHSLLYWGEWFSRPFSMQDDEARSIARSWITQVDDILGEVNDDAFLVSLSCDI